MTITIEAPAKTLAPAPAFPHPRHLSWDEANALLDRALAEKGPGYRYERVQPCNSCAPGCYNFDGADPSCLIGHLLSYLGYGPLNLVFSAEHGPRTVQISAGGVVRVFDDLGITADWRTVRMLSLAQGFQDRGDPWGECVAHARIQALDELRRGGGGAFPAPSALA